MPRKSIQYIFFELLPAMILGVVVFILILLMAQALRYTEFVLIHGVGLEVIGKIMGYLSISFLPALLPMSLLFAVLMTYGRLSNDSEIVALKACGLSMATITTPALLLAALIALISAQTSFYLAPWGNRQFELLVSEIGSKKASVAIREGTFSEGFFDKVVYANKVDPNTNEMKQVFIYDETQGDVPLAIIAKRGYIIQNEKNTNSVVIRLYDGDIHRKDESHTKVKFDDYDIKISNPVTTEVREKSAPSMTILEISEQLKTSSINEDQERTLKSEFHKRWALSIVCIIFALLGVGLGTNTNKRTQKSNTIVQCLVVVVFYWILYVTCEGMARSGQLPAALALWIPNFIFGGYSIWRLKQVWN